MRKIRKLLLTLIIMTFFQFVKSFISEPSHKRQREEN